MYKQSAQLIRKELDYLMQMCDQVKDLEICDGCPIENHCLQCVSIEELWSEVSESRLAEFLHYADTSMSDEDAYYSFMDNERKMRIEDEDL